MSRRIVGRYVILGFLAAASFVSMWMSDTVAAVMLIPVAVGLLKSLTPEEADVGRSRPAVKFSSSSHTDEEEGQISDGYYAFRLSFRLHPFTES